MSDVVRHSLFADADINGLDDFLNEDMTPFMTPAISNRIKRPSIVPRPSFQCFASINHEHFHGLDYDDMGSMDSMDITSNGNMQLSKEWDIKHLRIGSCRNTMSNKLNSVKEYLLETPPLPTIMSGNCMEFDIENNRIQLESLDVVDEHHRMPTTELSEITPNSADMSIRSQTSSQGSDRSREVLHRKNDGSLLSMLSFKFLTKNINPMWQ